MSLRMRAAFFASLTVVLAQLALPGRASPANDGAGAVAEPVQLHHAPHPATESARSWLPDTPADRIVGVPFARGRSALHTVSTENVTATEPGRFAGGMDAHVLLPPARAPPTHS